MPVHIHHATGGTIAGTTTTSASNEGTAAMTETSRPDKNRITRVTDSTGRVLGVRAPGVLQRMRMLEAVGPENARNRAYLSFAMLAIAVVEIDGEPCEPIASKRQLEARAQQLEEPGLTAVGAALAASEAASEGEERLSPEDLAKNG